MKPLGWIWIVVLLALAACSHPKDDPVETQDFASLQTIASPALSAIDSLMWVRPDSALACLLPYFDTCCRDVSGNVSTEYDRHYAHLLLAELLYKNDYAQTNRAELLEAVAYFDSLIVLKDARRASAQNNAFLDARAHFINGVGYYEHDSVVPACKEYLKALEVMEQHFEENELIGKKAKFMALTHAHLSTLFSDLYLHEQAINFGKSALAYYQKYDAEPWHIAWTLNIIGSHFDILCNYDSAYFYYSKGLEVLPDTNSSTFRDIKTHLVFLSYMRKGTSKEAINQLKDLRNNANSDKEYHSRCLTIGEIFYYEKQFDSAFLYYKNVFDFTLSKGSKKLAAERMVEINKVLQENGLDTSKYIDYLIPFANQEEINSPVKSQLTELYKSFVQRQLELVHQREKKKSQEWTIGIVIGFIVVLSVIVILYRKSKRKRLLLETQIKEEQLMHTIQQKSLSGRLKQKNQEMRKLQDQINHQNEKETGTKPTITFVEEPICRLIMDRVKRGQFKSQMDCTLYKDYALTKEQIMALHKAVNYHFFGFTMLLKKAYPQLTNSDLDYCCLYLLGLTDADIAALMQKAYPTISQRSRKLKIILDCKTSLPITLHNIANNNLSY